MCTTELAHWRSTQSVRGFPELCRPAQDLTDRVSFVLRQVRTPPIALRVGAGGLPLKRCRHSQMGRCMPARRTLRGAGKGAFELTLLAHTPLESPFGRRTGGGHCPGQVKSRPGALPAVLLSSMLGDLANRQLFPCDLDSLRSSRTHALRHAPAPLWLNTRNSSRNK